MFVNGFKILLYSDWIESFLTNKKQRAIVNGTPSSWHDVINGVPQ